MNDMTPPREVSGWLGLDVGGTFTDFVLIDEDNMLNWIKVPSTPKEPGKSTLDGVDELLATGVLSRETLDRLHHVHGTTLATNTLIERKGATVGLITTSGFRDLMELQRLWVPNPLRFDSKRPQPLTPREFVCEVTGRLNARGDELEPLNTQELLDAAKHLVEIGAEEIVICFIHSFTNPVHEHAAADAIRAAMPDVPVHASADIWPQAREFERATLAVINAYVRPKMSRYVEQLTTGLIERELLTEPRAARSNGGIERANTVKERPVVALLSGPAAGIAGAIRIAQEAGWGKADLVTLDVGGTSADIGVIRDGQPVLSSEEHIADFPCLIPTVAVSSIGAGGGSIIWLDEAGVLRVGPRSLGADPAPACYGKQSEIAGLTDAFLMAGWVGENEALGGKIRLKPENTRAALAPIAEKLGCSLEDVADGAISIGIAMMASETMRVLARRGVDAPEFKLVAFGGAGPLVGALLAEEVHIDSVLIPPAPGALSALGAALADVESDFVAPVYSRLSILADTMLSEAASRLSSSAEHWLADEAKAIPLTGHVTQWSADMRYDGQGYDVTVPLEREWLDTFDREKIEAAFHEAHHKTYGHSSPHRDVWMKELRLHLIGSVVKPKGIRLKGYGSTGKITERQIRIAGKNVVARIIPRDLLEDRPITGPAIIEQLDTTTLVPPGWSARSIGLGSLILEKVKS